PAALLQPIEAHDVLAPLGREPDELGVEVVTTELAATAVLFGDGVRHADAHLNGAAAFGAEAHAGERRGVQRATDAVGDPAQRRAPDRAPFAEAARREVRGDLVLRAGFFGGQALGVE